MATETIGIKNGPGLLGLAFGLFEGNANTQPYITFTLDTGVEADFRLRSVSWEDGSGQSWNLTGYLRGVGIHGTVDVYYHTGSRSGCITLRPGNLRIS